jgi:curved DNA-binding protein CbpA
MWWANDTTHHVHAKAWLEAGWLVKSPTEAIRTHIVTFSKIIYEKTYEHEKTYEYRRSYTTVQDICAYFSCPYPCDEKQLKIAYRKMVGKHHPDKVNDMGPETIRQAEEKVKEINDMYEKYQEAKLEELRREELERERLNQEKIERERIEKEKLKKSYYQSESYNDYNIDREMLHESNFYQSETKDIFKALIVSIAAVAFLGIVMKGCPAQKEPGRPPLPRIEYTLPKTEGSSITVKSNILTEYFGISYEQRQKSNLFMKDAYEYRYNGNGTWTITKKAVVNNTGKNYIDTGNKNEVENYLHSLGF